MAPTLRVAVKAATVAALAAIAAAATAPVAGGQALSPIFVGSPADACATVGRVADTCACSVADVAPRPTVMAPVEPSGLWCPVRLRLGLRYFCDEAGLQTCNVVCVGSAFYCAPDSLRDAGSNCRCASTGTRLVVVPQ